MPAFAAGFKNKSNFKNSPIFCFWVLGLAVLTNYLEKVTFKCFLNDLIVFCRRAEF